MTRQLGRASQAAPMKTASLRSSLFRISPVLALLAGPGIGRAAEGDAPAITINADQVKGRSSPILYGLMTEEINYSYDGGLYGELLANRAFQDNAAETPHWGVSVENGAVGNISLDNTQPLNDALKTSLKFEITTASAQQR